MNSTYELQKENLYSSLYETLGDRIISAFDRKNIEELMLNPDGKLFVKYADGNCVHEDTLSKARSEIIVRTVATRLWKHLVQPA